MKKIMVIMMVALMAFASSAVVFADETEVVNHERQRNVDKEVLRQKLVETFESYNPDALVAFNTVNEAHQSFHEAAKAERELLKEERKLNRESIRSQVMSGELTKEDVKAMIGDANVKETREELKAILDLKKVEVDSNRSDMKTVRTALREALSEESIDETYVAQLLEDVVTLLETHLEIDESYYDLLHDVY